MIGMRSVSGAGVECVVFDVELYIVECRSMVCLPVYFFSGPAENWGQTNNKRVFLTGHFTLNRA